MYLFPILALFLQFGISTASDCVCTQVDCPIVGKNTVIMGNGGTTITYTYAQHKDEIVVVSATGTVLPTSLDNGSETTSCTQKYSRMLEDDGKDNCDAGHILANRLGGYGNIPTNIFPQDPSINRGSYAQFEGKIYDCIHNDTIQGDLSWTFYYESNTHTMPNRIEYAAIFTGGYCDNMSSEFTN
jgi:hypothetical protein